MRIKCFVIVVCIAIFGITVFSQSVRITPKKVTYKRTDLGISYYKREFTVTYPQISDNVESHIKKNLQSSLSYWRIFQTPFKKHLEDGWTNSLSYRILYNKNNILAMSFVWEGSGAYPDSSTQYVVVDLRTGKHLSIKDFFKNNSMNRLLGKIRQAIRYRENITAKQDDCFAGYIMSMRENYVSAKYYPVPEKIEYKDLGGFYVTDKGVIFIYDYNFAHAVEACEPEQGYFLGWNKIKPHIRRDGLLARFIR